jgi:hypothetical protein
MLCNFTLRLRHGREIAQPYRFWGLLGFPPRSGSKSSIRYLNFIGSRRFDSAAIFAKACFGHPSPSKRQK